MVDELPLLFGLENWGEFGMIRYQAELNPGEKRRIPLIVPGGRRWLVFQFRLGDMTADVINFRFDGVRNYFEQNILIGTELLNHPTWPKPFISISGVDGTIVVENTDNVARDFSIVLDFYLLDDEIEGRIRELILAEREDFRKIITQLQYKTPKPEVKVV